MYTRKSRYYLILCCLALALPHQASASLRYPTSTCHRHIKQRVSSLRRSLTYPKMMPRPRTFPFSAHLNEVFLPNAGHGHGRWLYITGGLLLSSFGLTYNLSCDNTTHRDYKNMNEVLRDLENDTLYDPYKPLLEAIRNKTCIFVFGKISVGKSTLVNALYSGSDTMREVQPFYLSGEVKTCLKPDTPIIRENKEIFSVGHTGHSITQNPEYLEMASSPCYQEQPWIQDQVLVDFPGFLHKSGDEEKDEAHELLNCLVMGYLLKEVKAIKLCFLFDEKSLATCKIHNKFDEDTLSVLEILASIIKGQGEELLSSEIVEEKLTKLQIVITKPEGTLEKETLIEYLGKYFMSVFTIECDSGIMAMLDGTCFVDAADRPIQYKDCQPNYLPWWFLYPLCRSPSTFYSSADQDTVDDLARQLFSQEKQCFAAGKLYVPRSPNVFEVLKISFEKIKEEIELELNYFSWSKQSFFNNRIRNLKVMAVCLGSSYHVKVQKMENKLAKAIEQQRKKDREARSKQEREKQEALIKSRRKESIKKSLRTLDGSLHVIENSIECILVPSLCNSRRVVLEAEQARLRKELNNLE